LDKTNTIKLIKRVKLLKFEKFTPLIPYKLLGSVLNDTKNEILNIFSKFIFSKLKKKQYKINIKK
tara:strand:+ start:354 stop:548 length:195 start_codon:yes stop_codon:yes gene_type:complete